MKQSKQPPICLAITLLELMRVLFIYYSGLKAKVVSPGEIVGSNKVYEISPQVVYHLPVRNPLFIYSFIYFINMQTQVTRTVFIYLFLFMS